MKKQPIKAKKATTVQEHETAGVEARANQQIIKELIEPFKADIQKAQEAQDVAGLVARVNQFVNDLQAL